MIRFTKMHGCGNDYVYVDATEKDIGDPASVAVFVSDRHFGIGSDGLILIKSSEAADFEMAMYNADGSRGEMCGNGIRCVAKYVYDHGLTDKKEITVETLAGIKVLNLTVNDNKVESVRVDMGVPQMNVRRIPVTYPEDQMICQPLEVGGTIYTVTCVSMGNPHCVVFLDKDVRGLDLDKIGPLFEHHSVFPKRINTEFVNVIDRTHLRMRVWERGSGETMACGTGACAAVAAAIANGQCAAGSDVTVRVKGGNLTVNWTEERVTLTGSAKLVFTGEIAY